MNLVQIYMHFFIDNIPIKHEFESYFLISFGELYLANQLNGSLTANYSLYKPQTLIKTGFQSYFFVNLFVILCSYL